MHWVVWALLAAAFFGAYNFFIKVSSGHIHEVAGAVILQVVAAVLGLLLLLYLKWRGVVLDISPKGISFAVLAGLAVGLSEITSFYLFSKGVSVSSSLPIILGGSIIVGTALGMLFLRETINPLQVLAIGMIVAGVAILTAR